MLKYIEYGLETSTQMTNKAAEISFVTLMSNHVNMLADLKTHASSNFYLKTYPSFQHPLSENTSSTKLPCLPCGSWRSWRLWGMSVPVLDQRSELTGNHLWENLGSPFRTTFSVGKNPVTKPIIFSLLESWVGGWIEGKKCLSKLVIESGHGE